VICLKGDASKEWIPIASSTDLVPRHVFHGCLPGQDLAIWRADDGFVNIWQNQCPHRGVRLTIGTNDGAQLRCRYHGWCYANRTGACTYIPAHPGDSPAQTLINRAFPVIEKYGLVWTTLVDSNSALTIDGLENKHTLVLRAVSVNAPMRIVSDQLRQKAQRFDRSDSKGDSQIEVISYGSIHIELRRFGVSPGTSLAFFTQPVDCDRSVIRGVLSCDQEPTEPMSLLRLFSSTLNEIRDQIESDQVTVLRDSQPTLDVPSTLPELSRLSDDSQTPGDQSFTVRVSEKRFEADGIVALELTSANELLPAVQPGAHIDLCFPGKHAAQYSLVNGPTETDRYIIGIKLEEDGGGVSRYVHKELQKGDEVRISPPKNRFPLRRDAVKTVFIAGGIGITPILSMAKTLNHVKLDFTLHYFVRSESHIAFARDIERLGSDAQLHVGLSIEHTQNQISKILEEWASGTQLYVCGPSPMMEMVKRMTSEKDLPESMFHAEYFENPNAIDLGGAFQVVLSRSDKVLDVPQGKSILQVLQENGVVVPSSCEQGACGTCLVRVLSGDPIHQDVYLTESERRQGNWIATCVSRSDSDELVLDL
jgi:ferredoxin-NADP reductase/nitrite reductase/ring-hydroxylating ferredoxin subunit